MAEIADLNVTDASNIARFNEGQKVPTLNNGARALEGILARWFADTNGTITSTGTAPNYAVATSRTFTALANGQVVVWRAHADFASGTATLTVNALTQKNLVRQDGSALKVGDISQYQTIVSRYNSNADAIECLGIMGLLGDAAAQSDMETAISTALAVTPGRQQYHPGHPKAWVSFDGTGTVTVLASHNVSSVTDNNTGDYTPNFTTAFSGSNYAVIGCVEVDSGADVFNQGMKATGSCGITTQEVTLGANGRHDFDFVDAIFCGDQ